MSVSVPLSTPSTSTLAGLPIDFITCCFVIPGFMVLHGCALAREAPRIKMMVAIFFMALFFNLTILLKNFFFNQTGIPNGYLLYLYLNKIQIHLKIFYDGKPQRKPH